MALATSPSGSESAAADGPVLSLMNKRLRALRKKYNRILQMEASLAQGKSLNKEQEEVLRSKAGVVALIEDYEKLRSPLAAAVQEELSRVTFCSSSGNPRTSQETADESHSPADSAVEDLIMLLYFGCLFDVKPQSDFNSMMLTRTHERECCLTYDYVTDDATELLGVKDLDMISALGGLVTSRPFYSGISHRNALQDCLHHAKLWLQEAHEPIIAGSSVTYASLREKLIKIMASDYYTRTPEMKAPVDVAAAIGKYSSSCQVQVSETSREPISDVQSNDLPIHYRQQDDEEGVGEEDIQVAEVTSEQSACVHDVQKEDEEGKLSPTDGISALQNEHNLLETDATEHRKSYERKDQQYIPRRPHQNPRGGRGGRGAGLRGYPEARGHNGRGGGRGGFDNGRYQYYDHGYSRNYYNVRGRGGRGGGPPAMYNHHGAPGHGNSSVELDASA